MLNIPSSDLVLMLFIKYGKTKALSWTDTPFKYSSPTNLKKNERKSNINGKIDRRGFKRECKFSVINCAEIV